MISRQAGQTQVRSPVANRRQQKKAEARTLVVVT
jgi:hypothetical protein